MLKTIIRNLLKPLSFLPAIFLMYMIFSFSAQDGTTSAQLSYKVSYKIVETGGKILGADFEPWEIENLANRFHGPVRKLAHMTEYFALAVSVAFPLYVYGLRGILLMIVAGLFCVGFACADEYHQSMVAGRSPSERDVAIDSIGIFFGIIFTRIVSWTGRKTVFRPLAKKKDRPSKKKQQDYEEQMPAGQPQLYGNQNYYGQPQPYNQQRYHEQPQSCGNPGYYRQPQPDSNQGYHGQPQPYNQQGYHGQPHSYSNQGYYEQQRQPVHSGQRNAGYYPPPAYPYPPQNFARPSDDTSDKLSEDMSFKKLMNDLKDKKQTEHRLAHKPKLKQSSSDLSALDSDSLPGDDPDLEIEEVHFKS